jgi:AraC-like DNA-binding protein
MDYVNFCKNYVAVTNIPITLMKKNTPIYSAICERLSIKPTKTFQVFWEISSLEPNPRLCRYSPNLEYGWIHIEGTDYYVVIGPAFSIPVSDETIREYMLENAISSEHGETVSELLRSIPATSHQQFMTHLSLLYVSLNQKEVDYSIFYRIQNSDMKERKQQHTKKISDNMENGDLHNICQFDQQLLEHIRNGNVKALETFLISYSLSLKEGKVAGTPLRQAKNLFIMTVVKIGLLGAIPGGLDMEKTYQLMDLYVQDCERMQSIETVKNLEYSMFIDFCGQTRKAHIPKGLSAEVYQCVDYIRAHINEPITIEDVAAQIHRSASHTVRHFKKELGFTMGAFITRCKLEEAKVLLTHTDKSLAEISSYLCFTNQPYFHSVFKKQYGITPLQYRKQEQRR